MEMFGAHLSLADGGRCSYGMLFSVRFAHASHIAITQNTMNRVERKFPRVDL